MHFWQLSVRYKDGHSSGFVQLHDFMGVNNTDFNGMDIALFSPLVNTGAIVVCVGDDKRF